MAKKKELTRQQQEALLATLKARFEKNMKRHKEVPWAKVEARLKASPQKLWSLHQMEATGGEPDVILGLNKEGYLFIDCSPESPKGRRSVCYDEQARKSRKEHKPANSALGMAAEMGIEVLTSLEYYGLQQFGEFDTKTSSWLSTDPMVRKHGGAVFGDRRYDEVWGYHNGAESYYAARGFRGKLLV